MIDLKKHKYRKIVEKCYEEVLHRKADKDGLNHFTKLLETNQIDENGLRQHFKESREYKLSHPTDIDPKKISNDELMKSDWNARANYDVKFSIRAVDSQTEKEFWDSGLLDCDLIIGRNANRYDMIMQSRDPKNLKTLEIGCGIGRILVPMAEVFGEVIGVDVSDEMVKLGKEKISNIKNCKILENSGSDLSFLEDNYFDFCYSFIVFQHIPEKSIVAGYMTEVSRVLKPNGIFRFQVRGITKSKPTEITTWDGVSFSSKEIHKFADDNDFEILEENDGGEYFWFTFQLKK